jgi:ligand-binding sensor domain-containing protein
MIRNSLLLLLAILILLLAACTPSTPTPAPVPSPALASLPRPSPSALPPGPTAGIPALPASLPMPATTVATSTSPGWTSYDSINQVFDLAFAPDGALWALTRGGLVRWDLQTDTYVRYQIDALHMAVAPDGTLWLATEAGFCRFDGITCEAYADPTWAVQGGIADLAVASDGVLWKSSEGGVRRFDGQSWQVYPFYMPPRHLSLTSEGEVWAATPDGVAHYLPSKDDWVAYGTEQGLPGRGAEVVAAGPNGEVWASFAWEGLYRLTGDGWQQVEDPPGGQVHDIAVAADGTPWVGTVGGSHYPGGSLAYWDGQGWVEVSNESGLISFRSLAIGPGGLVAAATHLGLGVYEDGRWRLLRDGPASDRIRAVAVTLDGAAWFAHGDESLSTDGSGLSHFDGQEWRYHLGDTEVGALAVAPDGSLWAGAGCSVQRFDGSVWQMIGRCKEDLPLGNVLDIAFRPDGTAWVATGLNLARFDGGTWVVDDMLVHSVLASPDGALWASGWEGSQDSEYIARFDDSRWTTYPLADSYPGTFILGGATQDGRLWGVVPGRGVASFDGGDWTADSSWAFYSPPDALPSSVLSVLGVAPDGGIWVKVEAGVSRFDPAVVGNQGGDLGHGEAWITYTVDDGLGSPYVGTVAFGPDGEIWFGTTRFQPAGASGGSASP